MRLINNFTFFPSIKTARLPLALVLLLALAGCNSGYVTPRSGGSLDLAALGEQGGAASIAEISMREPNLILPARVAIARIQSRGDSGCLTSGGICLVSTRELEAGDSLERIRNLSQLVEVAPLNRLLVPSDLNSDQQLRQAAAQLRANLLFVYSMTTNYETASEDIGPLDLLTLGYAPNKKALVTTTASGALYDTLTGFLYGVFEGTVDEQERASSWSVHDAAQTARRNAEAKAFEKLMQSVEHSWPLIIDEYSEL